MRGEYGLRALQVLGLHYGEEVVPIQVIAEQQNIPRKFLEQILGDLKGVGAVRSRRGVGGGYQLAKRPEEITLASVIRHLDGALAPVSCVSERFYERCTCPSEDQCALRSVMKEVRDAVAQMMEKVTVADLCERARRLESEPAGTADYQI